MRFGNWDVVLSVAGRDIPIPEFKIEAHSISDIEAPPLDEGFAMPGPINVNNRAQNAAAAPTIPAPIYYPPIHAKMPLLTSWVPTQNRDVPFQVVVHSWTPLQYHADLGRMVAAGRTPYCRVRVFIDDVDVEHFHMDTLNAGWPIFINSCTAIEVDKIRRGINCMSEPGRAHLCWPAYPGQQQYDAGWNPRRDFGCIKVILSEGFKIIATNEIVWTKNFIAFAFRHAPLQILQRAGIAWPRDNLWWRPELLVASAGYGEGAATFFQPYVPADPEERARMQAEYARIAHHGWMRIIDVPELGLRPVFSQVAGTPLRDSPLCTNREVAFACEGNAAINPPARGIQPGHGNLHAGYFPPVPARRNPVNLPGGRGQVPPAQNQQPAANTVQNPRPIAPHPAAPHPAAPPLALRTIDKSRNEAAAGPNNAEATIPANKSPTQTDEPPAKRTRSHYIKKEPNPEVTLQTAKATMVTKTRAKTPAKAKTPVKATKTAAKARTPAKPKVKTPAKAKTPARSRATAKSKVKATATAAAPSLAPNPAEPVAPKLEDDDDEQLGATEDEADAFLATLSRDYPAHASASSSFK